MRRARALTAIVIVLTLFNVPARAQECARAVVITLPGVTWEQIVDAESPNLLAAAQDGAAAALSVRTNTYRTSYASGFATIGAGARVDGGSVTGKPREEVDSDGVFQRDVQIVGIRQLKSLALERGYRAEPGALATALSPRPVIPIGTGDRRILPDSRREFGRWTLLAAMDNAGRVPLGATASELLEHDQRAPYRVATDDDELYGAVERALQEECATVIVDHGDLARADTLSATRRRALYRPLGNALEASDELVAFVRSRLDEDRDLLLIASPTSPSYEVPSLGVAIAIGPGFEPGSSLESASTRRPGVVTLPDIAPTILAHHGVDQPASMNGRPWVAVDVDDEPIDAAIALNDEAVFVDALRAGVYAGFIIVQVLVYAIAIALLSSRERRLGERTAGPWRSWLERLALAIVAFPVTTYLAGMVDADRLGLIWFTTALVAIDVALVVLASVAMRGALDRFLALVSLTTVVMMVDLALGAPLQMNTVFGYSPIVAGRFAGIGNISFSVLGVAGLMTGAFLVHRRGGDKKSVIGAGLLFGAIVVADGAPQLGSDVGGVLALVPALAFTLVWLAGKQPSLKLVVLSGVAALVFLALFLAIDLLRPADSRTHLARLFLDVRERGIDILVETLQRKMEANIRVFRSTVWTLFVPPAVAVMAWLLVRPSGRWQRLAATFPKLRAGLVGGLVLAFLGFAVNDSGIVIPAVILSFLVPMALLLHLALEDLPATEPEADAEDAGAEHAPPATAAPETG